jgi:hypothetical protein
MTEDTVKGLTALLTESELSHEIKKDIEAGRAANQAMPAQLRRGGAAVSPLHRETAAPSFQEQLAHIGSATTTLREAIHRKVHEVKAAHDLRLVEIDITHGRALAIAAEQREHDIAAAERHTREMLAEINRIVARL